MNLYQIYVDIYIGGLVIIYIVLLIIFALQIFIELL